MSGWPDVLPFRVGQIVVAREDERIALCHCDDVGRGDLKMYQELEAAAEIARFDDAGVYRPLKTAPNLPHGWQLLLGDFKQAQLGLDYFYPGRGVAYHSWTKEELMTTPLRETLARQTGMYRVAGRISDHEASEVIASFCRSDGGCLRTILWKRDATGTTPSELLPADKFDPRSKQVPLLCQEACNLLVAEIRRAVKANG